MGVIDGRVAIITGGARGMVAPGAFAADPGAALAAALAPLAPDVAADRLNRAHVAATSARRISEVVRDPQLVVSEFVHVRPSAANVVIDG